MIDNSVRFYSGTRKANSTYKKGYSLFYYNIKKNCRAKETSQDAESMIVCVDVMNVADF